MQQISENLRRFATRSFLLLIVAASSALAEERGGWSYRVTPYLWGSGLEGSVATLPPAGPIEVDASFSDILKDLDLALMGTFEARSGGRLGFLADVLYMGLSTDADTPGPLFSSADYEQDFWTFSVAATYALIQEEGRFLDVVAGLTYWDLDNQLDLKAGILEARRIKAHETWLDPFIGVRTRVQLSERWFVAGQINSAIAGDSDSAWDIYGGIGYDLGGRYSIAAGYRHKEVDYSKREFLFDVEISGPIVGLAIDF